VLMLAAPQPAVAQLLEAAGASKTVVMCASVRQARRRAGVPAASA
jgi:anti-anti-sigma regulatory factor